MKKTHSLLLIVLVLLVWACNKDDAPTTPIPDTVDKPVPEPEPENQAPGMFELLEVEDLETDVTLTPFFKWNTSTDPDGDMIGYDLLLGNQADNQDTVAADLNTATYNLDEPLKRFTDYHWSVLAKDGKGKQTGSETFSFTTRNVNNPLNAINPDAGFLPRLLHTVTQFNDKLWLFGGADKDNILTDVWSSDDGRNWTGGDDPGFGPLRGHTALAFQGTLWLFGGRSTGDNDSRTNVIIPTNGDDLSDAPFEAPWPAREMHTSAVFQNKVWVLGGVTDTNMLLNDVWSTSDVPNWDEDSGKHPDATWPARFGHSTVVFDGKLWVIGGIDADKNYLNDVWFTTDGDSWTPVPQEKPFPKRVSHQTVVFDNKIWLVGGNDASTGVDDVELGIWYSADGGNWYELSEDYGFKGRIKPSLSVFEDQMLMIGGFDLSKYNNDVWVFD